MSRLIKERELDQELWESLNFMGKDDDDILTTLGGLLAEAETSTVQDGEADRLAGDREESARQRVMRIEHEAHEAREELRLAREGRIATRHRHSESKDREERLRKLVTRLKLHASTRRMGVVEWGMFKGFDDDMLPELQLAAKGGLKKFIASRRRGRHNDENAEISISEAEAV